MCGKFSVDSINIRAETTSIPSTSEQNDTNFESFESRTCKNESGRRTAFDNGSASSSASSDPFHTDISDDEYFPSGLESANDESDSDDHNRIDEEFTHSTSKPEEKSKSKPRIAQEFDFNSYVGIIKKWKPHVGVGNRIRCEICFKYQDTVRMYGVSRRNAQITTAEGTGNRTDVLKAHLITPYHLACMKRHAREQSKDQRRENGDVDIGGSSAHTTLERMVSALNAEKSDTISRFMMATYTDAKVLTSSAFSWPARIFTSEYARNYHINDRSGNREKMRKTNLQYMNPMAHSDFLECIVDVDRHVVSEKLASCLAMSLRADGSIDRTNIDKIYLLARIINVSGDMETLFLGIGEQWH